MTAEEYRMLCEWLLARGVDHTVYLAYRGWRIDVPAAAAVALGERLERERDEARAEAASDRVAIVEVRRQRDEAREACECGKLDRECLERHLESAWEDKNLLAKQLEDARNQLDALKAEHEGILADRDKHLEVIVDINERLKRAIDDLDEKLKLARAENGRLNEQLDGRQSRFDVEVDGEVAVSFRSISRVQFTVGGTSIVIKSR